MLTLWHVCAIFLIAGIYYGWRGYHEAQLRRRQSLRDRVAYMLWVSAEEVKDKEEAAAKLKHSLTA